VLQDSPLVETEIFCISRVSCINVTGGFTRTASWAACARFGSNTVEEMLV